MRNTQKLTTDITIYTADSTFYRAVVEQSIW